MIKSCLQEDEAASSLLRRFVGEAAALLAELRFLNALPSYLLPGQANQARIVQLVRKLHTLSRLLSVS